MPIQSRRRRLQVGKVCGELGINCLILERRATENYFPEAAIGAVYGGSVGAFGPYEKPPSGWSKARNWRVAREMAKNDLAGTDLGIFLEAL